MKYNKEFRVNQIYKSKAYPQFDFVVDQVNYYWKENGYSNNNLSQICYHIINDVEFSKFCDKHCRSKKVTFPYVSFGWCSPKSLKQKIKKYNMSLSVEIENRKSFISQDDEFEFFEYQRCIQ